jgi:hypothetical protein
VEHQSIACRIQKPLEQCNIKLGSVANNVLGVSGTAMLHALVQGESSPDRLADMAKMQLRRKLPALSLTLDGYLLPHQRFLLGEMLDELSHSQRQDCAAGSRDRVTDAAFLESAAGVDQHARHQATGCLDAVDEIGPEVQASLSIRTRTGREFSV